MMYLNQTLLFSLFVYRQVDHREIPVVRLRRGRHERSHSCLQGPGSRECFGFVQGSGHVYCLSSATAMLLAGSLLFCHGFFFASRVLVDARVDVDAVHARLVLSVGKIVLGPLLYFMFDAKDVLSRSAY